MVKTLHLKNGLWRYDESKPLGNRGGFATVYAGSSDKGDPVAVKIFRPDIRDKANRELDLVATRIGKTAAHVITVYDCGTDTATGQPAIVMARGEYSLSQHCKAQGALPEAVACGIAGQIVAGLMEVPEWVHRDLKPGNVVWCDERWQLLDFGIARIADATTVSGTMKDFLSPHYAAPEQWDGERATHATDVYALGCIVHELLTGVPLFAGTWDDLREQHRSKPAPISSGSPALQSFLRRMVAKPQDVRPSLDEVATRFRSFADAAAVPKQPASALSAASAAVSAQRSQAEAAAIQARDVARARAEIATHALDVLGRIRKALFDHIREEAPEAVIRESSSGRSSVMDATLGEGALSMSVGHTREVAPQLFSASGWDVVCWDTIQCYIAGYHRGASLWFVKNKTGSWQWLEASYFSWGRTTGAPEPCSLPPGQDADFAAATVMHTWQFAHPPRPIEGEGEPAFIERWTHHLAQAAQGQLARPSRLPED